MFYSFFRIASSFFLVMMVYEQFLPEVNAQSSTALQSLVNSKNLKYAGIGISIVDVENGKTICSYNENLSLTPASVLKIITTATALELFGPAYRFQTKIYVDGKLDPQGALQGDLLIVGTGDPTLGSEYFNEDKTAFLDEWLSAITKYGIRSISGQVIAVDHIYGYEGVSPRWIWQDLGNYYASATYGLSIFDNSYQLLLKSGAAGTTPQIIGTEPPLKNLFFDNHLKAAANTLDSVYVYGIPFSNERRLYGTLPAKRSPFSVKGDLPDPGLTLAETFSDFLIKNKIPVKGTPTTARIKPIDKSRLTQLIHIHKGKTLIEMIKITNFKSNNHFAEHLFYKTGWENEDPCLSHVPDLSAHKTANFWKKNGIDTDGLCMYDGCGLAVGNAVSAGLITDLLVFMQKKSKYADDFYSSLPLAGKEGTVSSFLKNTPLEGKTRVKSGSLSHVQSYAGYIEFGNKKYAFALIVNHYKGNRSSLRSQIEQFIVEEIKDKR